MCQEGHIEMGMVRKVRRFHLSRRKGMDQLRRMACQGSFASGGDGQGPGPRGGGKESDLAQEQKVWPEGREKGERLRKKLQVQGSGGHVGRVWIYSRFLENLWTFQARRCHDLISPFLFKILLGPVCRMG